MYIQYYILLDKLADTTPPLFSKRMELGVTESPEVPGTSVVSGLCDFKWSQVYLQASHLAKVQQAVSVCMQILTVAMLFEFTFRKQSKSASARQMTGTKRTELKAYPCEGLVCPSGLSDSDVANGTSQNGFPWWSKC